MNGGRNVWISLDDDGEQSEWKKKFWGKEKQQQLRDEIDRDMEVDTTPDSEPDTVRIMQRILSRPRTD